MNSLPVEPINSGALLPVSGSEEFLARVLVAEDDPIYLRVLEKVLTGYGYQVQCVSDGQEALERAWAPGAPRLLVLDWRMPGMCGPDICEKLRHRPAGDYQYILMLSAKDRKSDVVAGLEAGADDYLTKPFDSHELLARVRVGLRLVKLQNSLAVAQEQLRYQATHDSLTGIWNRGALLDLARGELERAHRGNNSVAVLLVDIDHFKQVNDKLGHQAGDAVLYEVARRLAEGVRVYDVIGRYGGEEFLVVAELNEGQIRDYGERLCSSVATPAIETGGTALSVSVSIGATIVEPVRNGNLTDVIRHADSAMYRAKRNGRNRVEIELP